MTNRYKNVCANARARVCVQLCNRRKIDWIDLLGDKFVSKK